jgi:hypothetical protein
VSPHHYVEIGLLLIILAAEAAMIALLDRQESTRARKATRR